MKGYLSETTMSGTDRAIIYAIIYLVTEIGDGERKHGIENASRKKAEQKWSRI